MKKFNLNPIEKLARVQYRDMRGFIEVDFHNNVGTLCEFLQGKGIDMKRFYPYAVEIYDGENVGQRETISLKVYLIDGDIYGYSYDEIAYYNGEINLTVEGLDVTYREISTFLKRLSAVITTDISARINVKIVGED